ncbi:hypothetical protein L2E82_31542 [Cichorium intybus]|uniref:Uncharacterized protein n=1 Tax=Cichorium intybus TaxID=13427 RepID=A0ACB9BDH2_CICIN|nr:hypothetical protein L2E82_31542 [Cichorium intybus]
MLLMAAYMIYVYVKDFEIFFGVVFVDQERGLKEWEGATNVNKTNLYKVLPYETRMKTEFIAYQIRDKAQRLVLSIFSWH